MLSNRELTLIQASSAKISILLLTQQTATQELLLHVAFITAVDISDSQAQVSTMNRSFTLAS